MATRCNVIVRLSADSTVILYRHWDGYPAVTGADLVTIARKTFETCDVYSMGTALVRALLETKRGGYGRDKDQPQYELTDSIHGDVEHVYAFKPWEPWGSDTPEKGCSVEHRERSGYGEEASWIHRTYPSMDAFAGRCVNPERATLLARLAERGQVTAEDRAAFAPL